MAHVVTFGEILLRLASPNGLRFTQTETYTTGLAGAEANVAAACAVFGHRATFVSAVPDNGLGESVRRKLRQWDIAPHLAVVPQGRLGLYFLESGASQRPAEIIYDRAGSAFAQAGPEAYDWETLLDGADWFHTTGINPALSATAADSTRRAMAAAKAKGLPVSFDPNYRARLWSMEAAHRTLEPLLQHVDLLISGLGQIADLFGITSKFQEFEAAADVARQVHERYGIRRVSIPRRRSAEGGREKRAALYFDRGQVWETPWLEFDLLEPLGGGDAFAGGLISSILEGLDPVEGSTLAVASAALKHSIPGDFLVCSRPQVEDFARGRVGIGLKR
jgi:2-dehydro-3-deoxygluconokinase